MMLGRVQVPPHVKRGEVFEVRVIVQHPMETGFRRDAEGKRVPRNAIHSLACRYNGAEVFRATLSTGIAANPYFVFPVLATRSGELAIEWSDDRGEKGRVAAMVNVT